MFRNSTVKPEEKKAGMNTQSKTPKPYGIWPSKISAAMVAGKSPRLAEPSIQQNRIFWLQTLPDEKGRIGVFMKNLQSQKPFDWVLPRPLSAKSKVHEYGGGSYCVNDNNLYFVLADDQQIYTTDVTRATFSTELLTRSGDPNSRYADLCLDVHRNALLAVCETHSNVDQEPTNSIVSVSLTPDETIHTVASGADFYSNPEVSPNGEFCVWLSWNHPDMPWDSSTLWLCRRSSDGAFKQENAAVLFESSHESIFQPSFSPSGDLFFVSDKTNWWNIQRVRSEQLDKNPVQAETITQLEAEFATPQWTFNMTTYGFLDERSLLATYSKNGKWHLVSIELEDSHRIEHLDLIDFADIYSLGAAHSQGVFIGSTTVSSPAVYRYENKHLSAITDADSPIPHEEVSIPQAFEIARNENASDKVYGFYYPPTNSQYQALGSSPPLIVICHGGPTGATSSSLNLKVQYWTNRGFAVMDVNYHGSTGFGRAYRHSLHENWGVYDVEDIGAAANYAVEKGWANPDQLIIKGSSAGGYTVLAALAFSDTFNAGVSLYGIGDLETLVRDTHKFEARYLDKLVGPYPEEKDRYFQRSPINFIADIDCPLLVFQGLEDKVVPPNQAQAMVDAVRAKGHEVRYITFADEGHGFRNTHNIERMLDEELAFYRDIFQL